VAVKVEGRREATASVAILDGWRAVCRRRQVIPATREQIPKRTLLHRAQHRMLQTAASTARRCLCQLLWPQGREASSLEARALAGPGRPPAATSHAYRDRGPQVTYATVMAALSFKTKGTSHSLSSRKVRGSDVCCRANNVPRKGSTCRCGAAPMPSPALVKPCECRSFLLQRIVNARRMLQAAS
jgi:hypothetical protein